MGKKVLISFLGTGPLVRSDSSNKEDEVLRPMREYRKANYKIDDQSYEGYTFMSLVLAKHYKVDKIIMVGTVHSMWEELYRGFYEQGGSLVEDDEQTYEIYETIGRHCSTANNLSELTIPHKDVVETAMGKGSKIVLIKYGINDDEIRQNINTILGLQEYLENNDELIVDVTHSFRSLPIFVMNLLIYLQNVSSKNINISHIHYGMLESHSELNYAPVVDLKAMIDVQEWITGAYAFSMFGNAYKIANLLEKDNKSVGSILCDFSDAMNLNYLYPMQGEAQKLSGLKNREFQTDLPKLIISPIVERYVKTFLVKDKNHEQSFFQLKLADWQFKHKKYGQAYLTSNDALITYVCELKGMDWDNFVNREVAKKELKKKRISGNGVVTLPMHEWFTKHNELRNGIAHTKKLSHRVSGHMKDLSVKEIINALEADIRNLKAIMKS